MGSTVSTLGPVLASGGARSSHCTPAGVMALLRAAAGIALEDAGLIVAPQHPGWGKPECPDAPGCNANVKPWPIPAAPEIWAALTREAKVLVGGRRTAVAGVLSTSEAGPR